jgi:pentatricopeptide repeat protein
MPVEELARGIMKRARASGLLLGGEYYGLLLQVLVKVKLFKEAVACFDLMSDDVAYEATADDFWAATKAASVTKDQVGHLIVRLTSLHVFRVSTRA